MHCLLDGVYLQKAARLTLQVANLAPHISILILHVDLSGIYHFQPDRNCHLFPSTKQSVWKSCEMIFPEVIFLYLTLLCNTSSIFTRWIHVSGYYEKLHWLHASCDICSDAVHIFWFLRIGILIDRHVFGRFHVYSEISYIGEIMALIQYEDVILPV